MTTKKQSEQTMKKFAQANEVLSQFEIEGGSSEPIDVLFLLFSLC